MSKIIMWIEDRFMDAQSHNTLMKYAGKREVLVTTDIEKIHKHINEIEIVLGDFPREYLSLLPNLKWFQQFGTGVEWLQNQPDLVHRPFLLTNCSDGHFDVVADHLMALLLGVLRGIPTAVRNQQKASWQQISLAECDSLFQIRGKTVLLVGLGSVGIAIATRLKAFGAYVIGIRRDPSKTNVNVDEVYPLADLNQVALKANIVVSCLPRTTQTNHLFDSRFFACMKKPAFFFNIGRGNAVNEDELANALTTGVLFGAGIDVCTQEPLSKDSPLWTLDNLLITPHLGGTYDQVIEAWRDVALENLQRYTTEQPLRNQVTKISGY
ncbi:MULTISPECIES: D-2-hydroxyacid dehydrogenase [Aliiglaciecola]|uniref:D-2-hydroxyacid dehydrogenase n=1 Tax=Aliiglaciecola TaxID=1406885 RepID=UPI001C089DE6|nr:MULTISPECIES: D-2-hydroxyacid dehydrogenase [Aliiglaciecola]MBU2879908.1 D-2-hydroxyacid dehydrogenase [Aliiglaciecola lipolytica]MDO6712408.1 D-2-hydroxyacid dehydrogenase [Aliiglaciecola sp. 2_MG-2023]MDO6753402.1 D-2-hydroxyacid dehydrogenase [Aliiglaciecola sp. 1_MG-2023]